MVRLPALCSECGALYPSPLRAGGPDADNAFAVPVPCPGCGGGGRVPAESLERTRAVVRVLREAGLEPARARELLDEVEAVCSEAGTREDAVMDGLRRVPELGRLVGSLPGEEPGEMATAVRLARVAAELVVEGDDDEDDHALATRVLESAYERFAPERRREAADTPAARARARLDSTGRNDPCPCGSGEKYKRCHWLEDRREAPGER